MKLFTRTLPAAGELEKKKGGSVLPGRRVEVTVEREVLSLQVRPTDGDPSTERCASCGQFLPHAAERDKLENGGACGGSGETPLIEASLSVRGCGGGVLLAICLALLLGSGCTKAAPSNAKGISLTPVSTPEESRSARVDSARSASKNQVDGNSQAESLADRLRAIQTGQPDRAHAPQLPDWKAIAPGTATPEIPIEKDLLVVTAISSPEGDFESFKKILEVSRDSLQMQYVADYPGPNSNNPATAVAGQESKGKKPLIHTENLRLIDVADLANAHVYREYFGASKLEHYPGSTAISLSTRTLNQLRAGEKADFSYEAGTKDALSQLLSVLQAAASTANAGVLAPLAKCSLRRVEPVDLAFPALVNDQPTILPAVHAACTADNDDQVNIYLLDLPANPLALAWQIGNSRLQIIRISFPPPQKQGAAASPIEQALARKKPVEVYGIYFDFDRSTIKPESDAVLRQIADILQKNPDWKLNVSGHTDNIGSDRGNLALSQRRASAVKNALVTLYHIAPDRLATNGFGASMPIADNRTLEGRARNRRVELQRQ